MTIDDHSNLLGKICDLLSHPMRQALLRVLWEIETPTTLETVTNELINSDEYQPDGIEQSEKAERVAIEVYHIHLPKMANMGVIDYDSETGIIRTNDSTDVAYAALNNLSEEIDS